MSNNTLSEYGSDIQFIDIDAREFPSKRINVAHANLLKRACTKPRSSSNSAQGGRASMSRLTPHQHVLQNQSLVMLGIFGAIDESDALLLSAGPEFIQFFAKLA